MTGVIGQSSAGRPRSIEADQTIIQAVVDVLVDRGIEATSIAQVARSAGVTRATVYRRYADKTTLLVAGLRTSFGDPPNSPVIRDMEDLVEEWATAASQARVRKLVRRLYDARDADPQLAGAYERVLRRFGDRARRALKAAQQAGEFPAHAEVDIVLDLLLGAFWQHLITRPDTASRTEVEACLRGVLRQLGHRPQLSADSGTARTTW